mmetsp:Transcript_885/g.1340  ORF Transcript_885/g.1340 Transcript_885/m.1340 type:complete len:171 (-) Transcript_885:127-639(-)
MDQKKLMGVASRRESSSMKQFIGDDDEDLSKSPDRTRSLNKIKKVKKFEKNQTAKNTVRGKDGGGSISKSHLRSSSKSPSKRGAMSSSKRGGSVSPIKQSRKGNVSPAPSSKRGGRGVSKGKGRERSSIDTRFDRMTASDETVKSKGGRMKRKVSVLIKKNKEEQAIANS